METKDKITVKIDGQSITCFLTDNNSIFVEEDKFSRKLGEMLKGNIPRVQTFVIVTEQNPSSTLATKKCNLDKKEELEAALKHGRFGFRRFDGMFDNLGISYFIPNMTQTAALDLGKRYNRTSVIYGEVKADEERKTQADMAEIKYDKYGNKIDGERLPATIIRQIEGLSKRALNESYTGKYRWECRAQIDSLLSKYEKR